MKRASGLGDFNWTVTEDYISGTNADDTIYWLQRNDEIRSRQGMILNGSTAHHKLTTTYIDIVLSTSGSILLFILEFISHFHITLSSQTPAVIDTFVNKNLSYLQNPNNFF
jgi:hypothetical protein